MSEELYRQQAFDRGSRVPTADLAREVVGRSRTYAEVSPSGTGVKLIGRGTLPRGKGRKDAARGVEAYDRGRYFTVTGQKLPDAPGEVADCQPALDWLFATLFTPPRARPGRPASLSDDEVIDRLTRTAYLWCISLGRRGSPPVIGLVWIPLPSRRTKSAVPGGAGSAPAAGRSACGLPAS